MKRHLYISSHEVGNARAAAGELSAHGHTVVSTWHRVGEPLPQEGEWGLRAQDNFNQISKADALVLFSSDGAVPGGKFVEAGYALALETPVYVIGRIENKMLNHPQVKQFKSVQELLGWLEG